MSVAYADMYDFLAADNFMLEVEHRVLAVFIRSQLYFKLILTALSFLFSLDNVSLDEFLLS